MNSFWWFTRFIISPLKANQACMRSHTASQPYSRTHATPGLGACFRTEEPPVWNASLAPQHRVQTFIQCCPFTRCFIARPGLILLGLIWASYSLMLTRLDDDSTAFPPNCSSKSLFLLRHWRSLTCSPFSLNNLNKHSVWSFSLHFATHSHSHPLAILTSFGLFCDSKWNLHIFFPDLMQQRIPWAKIDGSNLFFFIQCCIVPNFQNTTLKLEPFCWYIGRWIETKCSALYCFWNKARIFINL